MVDGADPLVLGRLRLRMGQRAVPDVDAGGGGRRAASPARRRGGTAFGLTPAPAPDRWPPMRASGPVRRIGVVRRPIEGTVVLLRGDVEMARWPLAGRDRPDLCLVDELARLQLAARRVGWSLRIREPSPELWELLDLVGLRVEVGGEAEGGEQPGVEEVVVADDPVA